MIPYNRGNLKLSYIMKGLCIVYASITATLILHGVMAKYDLEPIWTVFALALIVYNGYRLYKSWIVLENRIQKHIIDFKKNKHYTIYNVKGITKIDFRKMGSESDTFALFAVIQPLLIFTYTAILIHLFENDHNAFMLFAVIYSFIAAAYTIDYDM